MNRRDLILAFGAAALVPLAVPLHPAHGQSSGLVRGQVVDVDQSANEITIRHGPIKKLGMDRGMTMVFRAQEPAMLKRVKPEDRIRFDAQDLNGDYSITRIEKVK
jgi:Cu(I)/Ag(I) efflux system periplasmic protein CusF